MQLMPEEVGKWEVILCGNFLATSGICSPCLMARNEVLSVHHL